MQNSFNFGKVEMIDVRSRVRLPDGYLAVFRESFCQYVSIQEKTDEVFSLHTYLHCEMRSKKRDENVQKIILGRIDLSFFQKYLSENKILFSGGLTYFEIWKPSDFVEWERRHKEKGLDDEVLRLFEEI